MLREISETGASEVGPVPRHGEERGQRETTEEMKLFFFNVVEKK